LSRTDSTAASTTQLTPAQASTAQSDAPPMVKTSLMAQNQQQRSIYGNAVVTGTLSDSYLERASRSSTPSKMSVNTGVSNVSNGGSHAPNMVVLNVGALPPLPYRPPTPTQSYLGAPNSRPITPGGQGVGYSVNYATNPAGGREGSVSIQTPRTSPTPYMYQTAGNVPTKNNGNNYYERRYAPAPSVNDSEV